MNNIAIETQILKTNDYNIFKLVEGNRKINVKNYAKLVSSMKQQQLMIPICVNESFEIIDGQHRYMSCKELGLPVYYYQVKNYGIAEVKRANLVSSNWTKKDFLHLHAGDMNQDYIEFGGICERYGVSISNLIKIFAKIQDTNTSLLGKDFEDGAFECEGMDKVVSFLTDLEDFSFFNEYKSSQFFTAFMNLYFYIDYDHKIMCEKMKKRKHCFSKKASKDDYLAMLTGDIYSFGAIRKPIHYDVKTRKFYN